MKVEILNQEQRSKVTSELLRLLGDDWDKPIVKKFTDFKTKAEFQFDSIDEINKSLMIVLRKEGKTYVRCVNNISCHVNMADFLEAFDYEVDSNFNFIK